ncbi:hypothetical protein BOW53_11220 [Solemya pervernicosa gill symbiont]|uniref:Glycosyltransferase RgtA/B/C/D-like domain-containing protein n=2 Tax=Solemya pervernicosa gill symbiont TaxID=642797 RepID=A0A1T2L350_9GAMM|nr:hypothetical protein BOW53_11220 [Solemya pervernicosa gill symbiont]
MRLRISTPWLLLGGWLLLMIVSLLSRSYAPIDETRYVTVAWEMWLRGDYLVPHLNGETYSHKPPLLFWLFNLGWSIFGVNEWWPRLVPPLFGLGSLFLTIHIARRLWPEREVVAQLAPLMLLGSLFWAFYTTATMFDMMMVFFTLLGLSGVIDAWQRGGLRGWLILAVAIGLGVLAKGPVILLLTLPTALLAPWWMGAGRIVSLPRWYLAIFASVLGGAAIALAWAIPAAIAGGEAYADAIFWGQTAKRMVNSFAHRRGFFWYLPYLPILLFPWLLWPTLWRSFKRLPGVMGESGIRFVLSWIVPLYLALSLISGKQVHYLLPLFPAIALLAARLLSEQGSLWRDLWLPGLLLAAAGVVLLILPQLVEGRELPNWSGSIETGWGALLVVVGLALAWFNPDSLAPRMVALMAGSIVMVVVINIAVLGAARPAYDLHSMAERLGELQKQGVAIAHLDEYHGQYHFLGRLEQPLAIFKRRQLRTWVANNPEGWAVVYDDKWPESLEGAEFVRDYHTGGVALYRSDRLLAAWAAER